MRNVNSDFSQGGTGSIDGTNEKRGSSFRRHQKVSKFWPVPPAELSRIVDWI